MRVAVAAVLMLVLAIPAQGASSPRRASLKLGSVAPLTISGKQFGAREPVVVTYVAADETTRRVGVRAKRNGSFAGLLRPAPRPLRSVHGPGRRRAGQPGGAPGRARLQAEGQGPAEAGPCDRRLLKPA